MGNWRTHQYENVPSAANRQPVGTSKGEISLLRDNADIFKNLKDYKGKCRNCGTTSTPKWRRDKWLMLDSMLCNSCFRHLQIYKEDKPTKEVTDEILTCYNQLYSE